MQRQFHSWMQAVSEWLKNAAVTFLWVLCSHLSGEMWWETAAAAAASASSGSSKTTKTLLESGTHQTHTLTVCISEKARKEFHLVLTGLISYSVNSSIIHWDQSENRNCIVIQYFSVAQAELTKRKYVNMNNTIQFYSHKSCFSHAKTCKSVS